MTSLSRDVMETGSAGFAGVEGVVGAASGTVQW